MKILIVDDAEIMLLLIQKFVSSLGHQAVTASNGQMAVEAYRAERPDLVLMDMMMPVMDGPEAAMRIKAIAGDRWVPIVFVTGIGEDANDPFAQENRLLGYNDPHGMTAFNVVGPPAGLLILSEPSSASTRLATNARSPEARASESRASSSTRRTERARPTLMGTTAAGKSTALRRGSTGRISIAPARGPDSGSSVLLTAGEP